MTTPGSSLLTVCEASGRAGGFAPATYYYGYLPARAETV
jgi:hypothetical protein